MAETPFKLKSGNTPLFKQMGSSPTKHIGRHPSPKDGHEVAAHKEMGLFKALTGTKLGDVKVGKKPVEGEEDTRKSLKETKVGKQVSRTVSDIKSLGTDISTGQQLGTTKKTKAEAADKEAADKAAADKAAADKAAATTSYKVQKGDNLTRIARANKMTLGELLEKNPSYKKNPNLVRTGATLNL